MDNRIEPRPFARLFPFAWFAVAGSQTRTRPTRPIAFTPSRVEPIPAPPHLTPSPAEKPSAGARVAQLGVWVLITLGWLVFAAWWAIVLRRESMGALGFALGVVVAIVVVCAVGMAAWTRHNIQIARTGKRGYSSLFIPMRWKCDTLGRPIELPARAIATTAPDVRVVMRDGVKVYVAATEATP